MKAELTDKSSSELLRAWCETTLALVDRHDLPSVAFPMSGLAERLVAAMFKGTVAPTGQRDWDVTAGDLRIQVKALWDVGRRTRQRLGTIGTDLNFFIAVVFDARGRVAEVWEVADESLKQLRGDRPRAVVRLPWVRQHGKGCRSSELRQRREA